MKPAAKQDHWLDRRDTPSPKQLIGQAARNAIRCAFTGRPAAAKAFAVQAVRLSREEVVS